MEMHERLVATITLAVGVTVCSQNIDVSAGKSKNKQEPTCPTVARAAKEAAEAAKEATTLVANVAIGFAKRDLPPQ